MAQETAIERLSRRLAFEPRALPEDTRRANRSLLLRALHHGGPASRAELSKLMGVTPPTVSSLVKDLLNEGVLDELGRTSGSIGKPATMVGIEPDSRHVIAVSLSEPNQFVGAVVNLAGKVVARRTYEREDRTGDDAIALVAKICDDLTAIADRPSLGIGIASPGIVEPSGTVLRAARLGWQNVALARELGAHTRQPVHVINDANAAAMAELTFGQPTSTNLVLVRIDQGVGAGLVLDGALFRGARSASGEIGHVVVHPDGRTCACGKQGCLETEISAPTLTRLLQAAEQNDGTTSRIEVLRHAGEQLGTALATVLSALDISDVVISGPEPVVTETFRAATIDALAALTMPEISAQLTVRPSSFGDDDVVLGAAALVLDHELGIR